MPDLREATPDEVAQSLAHALIFSGKRRHHQSGALMADIVAKRLVGHLQLADLCGHEEAAGSSALNVSGSPWLRKPGTAQNPRRHGRQTHRSDSPQAKTLRQGTP